MRLPTIPLAVFHSQDVNIEFEKYWFADTIRRQICLTPFVEDSEGNK